MDLKDISQLVELMNEHGLSHFRLEKKDFELELKKGTDMDAAKELLASMPSVSAAPAAAPIAAAPVAAASAATPASGETITSPMVGTFYTKPAPDADAFLKVGDTVSEGQTICIIEAMKVMNEIKAEKSGKITAILVEDGTPVQFGDDLFQIG